MSASRTEHRVVLQPASFSFPAQDGESVMSAAQRAGINWPTVCGGNAECGVCYVELLSGQTSAPQRNEVDRLAVLQAKATHGGRIRLGCQLRVLDDLSVFRAFIRVPRSQGDR